MSHRVRTTQTWACGRRPWKIILFCYECFFFLLECWSYSLETDAGGWGAKWSDRLRSWGRRVVERWDGAGGKTGPQKVHSSPYGLNRCAIERQLFKIFGNEGGRDTCRFDNGATSGEDDGRYERGEAGFDHEEDWDEFRDSKSLEMYQVGAEDGISME